MASTPSLPEKIVPGIERRVLVWFGAIAAICLAMVAAAVWQTSRFEAGSDWVNHTHAVILEVDAVLSSLHAAEAAHREFLLTGAPASQSAYREAFAEVANHLDVAGALIKDSPDQQAQLARISSLVNERVELAKRTVQARAKGPGGVAPLLAAEAAAPRPALARLVADMRQGQNNLLAERDRTLQRHTRATHAVLYGGAALNLGLLAFAACLIRIDSQVRRRAAAALAEANATLENRVRERTAELATANERLQIENLEQKWAQAALLRLQRHNEVVFNSIKDAVFTVSRNGRIISANVGASKLRGVPPGRLAGQDLFGFVGGHHEASGGLMRQAVKAGDVIAYRLTTFMTQQGDAVAVELSSQPTSDEGRLVGAVVMVRDLRL